jgi:hypothetical protein
MRRNRVALVGALVGLALGLQPAPASAVTKPWSGTATLTASATSYTTNQSPPTYQASVSPSLTYGYFLSVYNDLGQRACYVSSGACSGNLQAPLNESRSYTAYVSHGTPPSSGPPTNDVRATSSAVTVTKTGYAGTLTLTTPNSVVDNGSIVVTVAAVPAPGSPYTVSIYRADTGQRLTTCSSTCSVSVGAPADGSYYTLAAYVASDAPTTSLPTQNVDGSAALTITNSSSNVSDYATLLGPYVAQHSIAEFCVEVAGIPQPHTEESGSPGVLGSACLSAEAAGMTLPNIVKAIVSAAGLAGGGYLAYQAFDQLLSRTGTVNPTAPHLVLDPEAPPSSTLPGLPPGPDDQLLDLMKARRQGPSTQPWSDTGLKTVVQQCRDLMAQYGGSLAPDGSQRCDNTPLFVPSAYDAEGPTNNDLAGIVHNPAWLLLHYVSNAVKPRTRPAWYDTADYRENNACVDRTSPTQCDEYPFLSSAEGGSDNVRAATSPRPQLAPVLGTENVLEGNALGAMYKVCRLQSGATPTDQSVPESEYLVIPIPWKELGVPTGFLC